MHLLEQLKMQVLDPLASSWAPVFFAHGLDITRPLDDLENELERPLPIDRASLGIEHLALASYRAVEPGKLSLSLLYHVLASANVSPNGSSVLFPTLAQLDVVENYIYSRARARLAMFNDPVIAIFAYQYRDRDQTTHRSHSDLVFSRIGIARVGTEPPLYVPERRCFEPRPKGSRGFRVLPARYATFIAERRPQPPNGSVMRAFPGDAALTFLFPVHKLFPGDECLFGDEGGKEVPVCLPRIKYVDCHVSEKLARIHSTADNLGYIPPMTNPAFDLSKPPFVRDSRMDHSILRLTPIGASVLVEPLAQPLVSLASQKIGGADELARFIVPGPAEVHGRMNRYWSTFEIPADGESRAAPEYVNIRTEVRQEMGGTVLVDLNQLPSGDFEQKVRNGGYEAAHFIDNSCDGALTIEPISTLGALPIQPAYSLIAAVDYFPSVDQVYVEEWLEKRSGRSIGEADIQAQFPQGGPKPMSDGRFEWKLDQGKLALTRQLPNCNLPHPTKVGEQAFSLSDPSNYTASAVVGAPPASLSLRAAPLSQPRGPTWLPDAAAGVFAPGWDVSQHQTANQNMYAAYGLGSPFPEDAKLCAALNSFWPAVAPDSARTYGWRPPPPWSKTGSALTTAIPLTDSELGYHPGHPLVTAGEVATTRGWDGDYGPFILTVGGVRLIDASNPMRADQTRAALAGQVGFSGLDGIDTPEFICRMEALRWCRKNVAAGSFDVGSAWLITLESVGDWSTWKSAVWPKAGPELKGAGMIFLFALTGPGSEDGTPPLRRRFPVQQTLEIQMSSVSQFSDLTAVRDGNLSPTVYFRLDKQEFDLHGQMPLASPIGPAVTKVVETGNRYSNRSTTTPDTRLPQ